MIDHFCDIHVKLNVCPVNYNNHKMILYIYIYIYIYIYTHTHIWYNWFCFGFVLMETCFLCFSSVLYSINTIYW